MSHLIWRFLNISFYQTNYGEASSLALPCVKNDTAVTEVSLMIEARDNGFAKDLRSDHADELCSFPGICILCYLKRGDVCGYDLKAYAMEVAKVGALKHIAAWRQKPRKSISVPFRSLRRFECQFKRFESGG